MKKMNNESKKLSNYTFKSFGKINLTLEVLGKNSEKLHEIIGVFQTIDLSDVVSFKSSSAVKVRCENYDIPQNSNIVFHTVSKLKDVFNIKEGVDINIKKNIPISSGFGGGSSNAALTLITLNKVWGLKMNLSEMVEIGILIGSDVPFFLFGGTALVSGVGEQIEKLPSIKSLPLFLSLYNQESFNKTENMYRLLGKSNYSNGAKSRCLTTKIKEKKNFESRDFYNVFNQIGSRMFPEFDFRLKALSNKSGSNSFLCGSGPSMFSVPSNPETDFDVNFPFFYTHTL